MSPCPRYCRLFPIRRDPRRGQHAAIPLATAADERVGRIRQAVEDDDLGFGGDLRRLPQGEREIFHAVLLEAAAPGRRPVADLALRGEMSGQIFLLVAMTLPDGVEVRAEIFQDVGIRPGAPAVDGRVPGVVALLPVADDQEVSGMIEEAVHVADDDDVDVEEEDVTLELRSAGRGQRRRERDEFGPAPLGSAGRQLEAGDRESLDTGVEPGLVVRQADEAIRDGQVAAHHGVEPVHVFWAVFLTPLHAKD